jgi:hypothetical protein
VTERHAPVRTIALDEMAAEVERLNGAAGDARFYLGVPANALADYTVRDRTLFGQPDVVARCFSLERAVAEVRSRNAEVVEREMATYLAIRSSGDILRRASRRSSGPSYLGIAALFFTIYLAALVAVLALTAAGVDLAREIAGWMR